MKNKLSLIISTILIVVAILLFLKGDNTTGRTVVFALLIITNPLNIIRGFINIWNEGNKLFDIIAISYFVLRFNHYIKQVILKTLKAKMNKSSCVTLLRRNY